MAGFIRFFGPTGGGGSSSSGIFLINGEGGPSITIAGISGINVTTVTNADLINIGIDAASGNIFSHSDLRNLNNDDHCFSADTELLTNRGFVNYKDILDTDKALTFNKDSEQLEFQPILAKYVYDNFDEIVSFKSRRGEILVTKGHTILYKNTCVSGQKISEKWFTCTAEEALNKTILNIPVAGKPASGEMLPLSNKMLELLGLVISEGHFVNPKTHGYAVLLYQKGDEQTNYIRSVLNYCHAPFIENTNTKNETTFYIRSRWARENIRNWINEKNISDKLLSIRGEQFLWFLSGLILGDGSVRSHLIKGGINKLEALEKLRTNFDHSIIYSYHTANKSLSDKLSYLCTLNGFSPTQYSRKIGFKNSTIYTINIINRSTVFFDKENRNIIPYSGDVWCVSVPNKTLVLRRNGFIFIAGNTHYWLGDGSRAVSGNITFDQSGIRNIGSSALPAGAIYAISGTFGNGLIVLRNDTINFADSGNIFGNDITINGMADLVLFGNTSATLDSFGDTKVQSNEEVILVGDADGTSGVIRYRVGSGLWTLQNMGGPEVPILTTDNSGIQTINGLSFAHQVVSGVSGIIVNSSGSQTHFVLVDTVYLDTIFATDAALNSSGNAINARLVHLESLSGISGIQSINGLTFGDINLSGVSGVNISQSGNKTIFVQTDNTFLDTIFATDSALNSSGNALTTRIVRLEGVSGTLEGVGYDGGNIDLVPGSGIAAIIGSTSNHTIIIHTSGFSVSGIQEINGLNNASIAITGLSGVIVDTSGTRFVRIYSDTSYLDTIFATDAALNSSGNAIISRIVRLESVSGTLEGVPFDAGNIDLVPGFGIESITGNVANHNITFVTSGSIRSINHLVQSGITITSDSGIIVRTTAPGTITIGQQSGSIEGVSHYLGGNIDLVPPSGWNITGNDSAKTITFTDSGIFRINGSLGPHINITGASGVFATTVGDTVTIAQQSGGLNNISTHIGGNVTIQAGSGISSIDTSQVNRTITINTSGAIRTINALSNPEILINSSSGIIITNTDLGTNGVINIAQQSGSIENLPTHLGGNIDLVPGFGINTITSNYANRNITFATSGFVLPNSGLYSFNLDIGGAFEDAGTFRSTSLFSVPAIESNTSGAYIRWTFTRPHNWVSGTPLYANFYLSANNTTAAWRAGLIVLERNGFATQEETISTNITLPATDRIYPTNTIFKFSNLTIASGDMYALRIGSLDGDPANFYRVHAAQIIYSGYDSSAYSYFRNNGIG